MVNFTILTLKILKAIRIKHGVTLLLMTEQKMSERTGRVYTEYTLRLGMTLEKFNEMFPSDARNPKIHKSKYASRLLFKTVKQEELFRYILEEIWKPLESGEMYEKGREAIRSFRGRRYNRGSKGADSSTGVLQDALTGEELPGGISERAQCNSAGEGEGDTVEA